MTQEERILYIQQKALEMRKDCIEMGYSAGGHGAHFGPAMSCIEAVACLFFGVMNGDPMKLDKPDRDRFVLSKGHACLAYYAALIEAGYVPKELMAAFKGDGSFLTGHPGCHPEYGLEVASGSLGNGFALACGIAMGAKIKQETHTVYCIAGDGECNEGVVWEAAMNAAKYQLDNLIVIIDHNGFQLSGRTRDVMDMNLEAIWSSFGWEVHLVADGNDVKEMLIALNQVKQPALGKPQVIIAATLKGKGISFMEGNLDWHAAPISRALYEQAKAELAAVPVRGWIDE